MTSAEHECVIEALGQATWGQFLQGTRFPNPEEDDIIHACASSYVRGYFSQSGPDDKGAASPELDAPLPESPPDELISVTIGPVTITTYNPVTITRLENSTNLYFLARNNSTEHATIHFTSLIDIIQKKPDWIPHFFHQLRPVDRAFQVLHRISNSFNNEVGANILPYPQSYLIPHETPSH